MIGCPELPNLSPYATELIPRAAVPPFPPIIIISDSPFGEAAAPPDSPVGEATDLSDSLSGEAVALSDSPVFHLIESKSRLEESELWAAQEKRLVGSLRKSCFCTRRIMEKHEKCFQKAVRQAGFFENDLVSKVLSCNLVVNRLDLQSYSSNGYEE
ncbi:hypothetical protein JHK85_032277 [Glycine max]|nr:hypothetical protein JHK85_032277 [Glycine max]